MAPKERNGNTPCAPNLFEQVRVAAGPLNCAAPRAALRVLGAGRHGALRALRAGPGADLSVLCAAPDADPPSCTPRPTPISPSCARRLTAPYLRVVAAGWAPWQVVLQALSL